MLMGVVVRQIACFVVYKRVRHAKCLGHIRGIEFRRKSPDSGRVQNLPTCACAVSCADFKAVCIQDMRPVTENLV
jgi:hypothetical protein